MTECWAIILAAGASVRFGSIKTLALWRGNTLLDNALAIARAACGENVMVVTGCHAEALAPYLMGVHTVYNDHWADGMGASIACGVNALPTTAAALILPVDQPLITVDYGAALLALSVAEDKAVLTRSGNLTGPPTALPARLFDRAKLLTGENGLKTVLHADEMLTIDNAAALRDADTPAQLQKLESAVGL